jgi:hypothetical protein
MERVKIFEEEEAFERKEHESLERTVAWMTTDRKHLAYAILFYEGMFYSFLLLTLIIFSFVASSPSTPLLL